jgi:hypothetical protein
MVSKYQDHPHHYEGPYAEAMKRWVLVLLAVIAAAVILAGLANYSIPGNPASPSLPGISLPPG